jgi:PHP family Zn ribbon phosphoesterase
MQNTEKAKYWVTLDERKLSSKPDEKFKKTITQHLIKKRCLTINEFAGYVTQPYGYTWSGGMFNGTRSNSAWTSQQVFALDFDKGTITPEEVIDTIDQFGFKPQLYYSTFSDSPAFPKFRVVFFLESPITDIRLHKMIYTSLMSLFADVDKSCKDASRYFYGGKNCSLIHTDPINTAQFLDALSIQLYTSDSGKFRSLPIDSEYYKNPVEKGTFYNYNYYNARFQTVSDTSPHSPTTVMGAVSVKIDIEKARKSVKILDEFLNGTWLYHMQLFGLATNLVRIKGGFQLMKATMKKYNKEGKTEYTQNNFNILPYVKKLQYPMMPVYKFSPYPEDIDLYDIVSTTRNIRGWIEYKPTPKISLKEAENMLDEKFNEVVEHGETGKIYLISMPTALGKTEKLIGTHATIALPTNSLKNEIADRFKCSTSTGSNFKFTTTPDAVEFESKELNLKQKYFYTIGLPAKSMRLLHYVVRNSEEFNDYDVMLALSYLGYLQESLNSKDTVITTHKRALFTEFQNDTLIFDEDPLSSLLEIKKLKISDLFLLNQTLNDPELAHFVDYLNKTTPLQIEATPTFNINIDNLIDKLSHAELESNVFEFFSSSFFMRDSSKTQSQKDVKLDTIHYIVKKSLPPDKKVVIMSATLPVSLYKMLYGDKIVVHEINNVQQQGRVIQYTQKSCSRQGLKKYGHLISKTVGNRPVLTFKGMRSLFRNPVEGIWFGNCSGYDGLKGQDIAIVGTPHRNPLQYLLTAKVCGIDFNTSKTTMSYQKVEYKGYKFMMNCYDNEQLRSIQLSLIESDLIQAVGRARTLRTDATVEVYSNFPISLSGKFIF